MEIKSSDKKDLGRLLVEVKELRELPIPDRLEKGSSSSLLARPMFMAAPLRLGALGFKYYLFLGVGPIMKVTIGSNSYEALPKDTSTSGPFRLPKLSICAPLAARGLIPIRIFFRVLTDLSC